MFKVNELVVYGLNGVCKIVDIKKLQLISNRGPSGDYYYLNPISSKEDHLIYVPVDKVNNENGVMRALSKPGELEDILNSVNEVQPLEIVNEKYRREEYKAALLTLSPKNSVALIKSVRNRKKRLQQRKNISETDLEFEKLALKFLCLEMSVVLGISTQEAEYRILDSIDFE